MDGRLERADSGPSGKRHAIDRTECNFLLGERPIWTSATHSAPHFVRHLGAHGDDPVARDRHRLRPGLLGVERVDLAVAEDHGGAIRPGDRAESGARQGERRRDTDAGERRLHEAAAIEFSCDETAQGVRENAVHAHADGLSR